MLRWKNVVGAAVVMGLVGLACVSVVLAEDACTRTYRGDLVLEGNERLVITEGVLCVGGNIILRDNARLEIRNATLRMTGFEESLWDPQVGIELSDGARLVMTNVVIHAPPRSDGGGVGPGGMSVAVGSWGTARVQLESVSVAGGAYLCLNALGSSSVSARNAEIFEAQAHGRGSLELDNCSVGHVVLGVTGASAVELDGLRGGYYTAWRVTRGADSAISVSLQNTEIGSWGVHVGGRARVTLHNSEHVSIGIHLDELPDHIVAMRPEHFASWSLRQEAASSALGNVKLINTSVRGWNLYVTHCSSMLTLTDSQVGLLEIGASAMPLRLVNTTLGGMVVTGSQLALECEGVSLSHTFGLADARLRVSGSVSADTEVLGLHWDSSSVGREYEVQVRDNAGNPAPGVHIGLEDPNGRVTHRTTDQEGVVRFTIWFYNRNYDHTWHLLVPQGDTTARVPITLLTSTPVQVTSW